MFDLKGSRNDPSIAEEVQNQLAVEVADADAFRKALVDKPFHRLPSLLNGSLALYNILAIIREAGWISFRRVNVFETNRKVHNVKVEIVDAPILELFLANGLHALFIVEGVPKLGDKKEVFTLDKPFFDGTGNALARFCLVAVVCGIVSLTQIERSIGRDRPHAPSKRR